MGRQVQGRYVYIRWSVAFLGSREEQEQGSTKGRARRGKAEVFPGGAAVTRAVTAAAAAGRRAGGPEMRRAVQAVVTDAVIHQRRDRLPQQRRLPRRVGICRPRGGPQGNRKFVTQTPEVLARRSKYRGTCLQPASLLPAKFLQRGNVLASNRFMTHDKFATRTLVRGGAVPQCPPPARASCAPRTQRPAQMRVRYAAHMRVCLLA